MTNIFENRVDPSRCIDGLLRAVTLPFNLSFVIMNVKRRRNHKLMYIAMAIRGYPGGKGLGFFCINAMLPEE